MKKLLIGFLVSMALGVSAQPLELFMTDLRDMVKQGRLGTAVSLEKKSPVGVLYSSFARLRSKSSKREYVTFNVGGSKDFHGSDPKGGIFPGLRVDSLVEKIGSLPWVRKYFVISNLPAIEVTPMLLTSDLVHFEPRVGFAYKF